MTAEYINSLAEEVFSVMREKSSESDLAKVKTAYELALKAHDGQFRKGGDPYIVHPIAVAKIVAKELELGANEVCAAFLHDVVEDTPYTIEDIRNIFGDDVAFLVDVVTKRKKNHGMQSNQVDNFKQILDSVHFDIRALMIKLADRLHNMRTLDSMRPDKQMKIAGETDFFYAPLANRLGLYRVKSELENLSFRFRCPRNYEIIDDVLQKDKDATEADVVSFTDKILKILSAKGINARTEVRYRKPYSIWKEARKMGVDAAHVEFKHYIRIIYTPSKDWNEKDTSLYIYSTLTDNFRERTGSVINYIDNPKENGYQSFHVKMLRRDGQWEELHISSERMLRNSRLGCIDKTNEESMNQWLGKLRDILQDMAQTQDAASFMEGVTSSFYTEDIHVFTPHGRVLLLPQDATALDFAYELHTDIGDHAQYARINGKLCSIKSTLHRGDCVEIGTSDQISPNPDWLKFVKTYKASKHIATRLKKRPSVEFNRCSCCHPLPGDEVIGFKAADGKITLHTRHCSEAIRLASEQGDSIVAVDFTSSPDILYPVRINISGVDRYHLLRDVIDCITEYEHLSIGNLCIQSQDQIANGTIDFYVHNADELTETLHSIRSIRGVDEVQRCETDN